MIAENVDWCDMKIDKRKKVPVVSSDILDDEVFTWI
jgi:hypothetical protein